MPKNVEHMNRINRFGKEIDESHSNIGSNARSEQRKLVINFSPGGLQ